MNDASAAGDDVAVGVDVVVAAVVVAAVVVDAVDVAAAAAGVELLRNCLRDWRKDLCAEDNTKPD